MKYRQNRDPAKILLDQEKDRIRKNERKFGQTGEERQLEKEAVENESKYNEAEENRERIRRIRKKQTEKKEKTAKQGTEWKMLEPEKAPKKLKLIGKRQRQE